MTRRRILRYVALFIGLAGAQLISRLRDGDPEEEATRHAIRRLVEATSFAESAAAVGKLALANLPSDMTPRDITREIARTLNTNRGKLAAMELGELRRRLQAHISAEHIAGDTLSVEGWELSATEARLYALAFLAR